MCSSCVTLTWEGQETCSRVHWRLVTKTSSLSCDPEQDNVVQKMNNRWTWVQFFSRRGFSREGHICAATKLCSTTQGCVKSVQGPVGLQTGAVIAFYTWSSLRTLTWSLRTKLHLNPFDITILYHFQTEAFVWKPIYSWLLFSIGVNILIFKQLRQQAAMWNSF